MLYSSFRPLYLCTFAFVRVARTSKAMQTTAIRTVANSLPENGVILLTFLISKRYIPYTDLRKISRIALQNKEWINNNPIEKTFAHSAIRTGYQ